MTTLSSEEISAWIVLNRRGYAFKNMTFEQIHAEIVEAMEDNCLIVNVNSNGYIVGVATIEPRLHIKNLLTNSPSSFGTLMDKIRNLFPYIRIFQAWRRNKKLTVYKNSSYMIDKLIKKEVKSYG